MDQNSQKKGSVLGGILLVSGCCIGAGMLGLPVLSAMTGFVPSVTMLLLIWIFMTCTGLLLLEVNLWFPGEVNIISMTRRTLGFPGQAIAWVTFLFLFYSLMVAYTAANGALVADFVQDFAKVSIPEWLGSALFALLLGVVLYAGTSSTDRFNRILMLGLVISYAALMAVGIKHVHFQYLAHQDWSMALLVLPAMIVSFGFHNLVPSLVNYLNHDVKRLRLTIIIGSSIPLLVYLLWEFLILGLIPVHGMGGFKEAFDKGQMATRVLRAASGVDWVSDIAQFFAFFAIVTSFVGVALSFIDFLADGLKVKKTASGIALLCTLVILPPFLFALVYPQVFLAALSYAGGLGTVTLFGILPAAMAWVGRYRQHRSSLAQVPGGKGLLIMVILFSLFIICIQLSQEFLS